MKINTNVSAIQAYTNLGRVQNALQDSMAKLSSGLRINKASDDAAGLGIANNLRASNRALGQASANGQQASAMLQVAEGGASAIESILERMKELAAQSASSNSGDRVQLQSEFDTLRTEITRITATTDYQGTQLLDGTLGTSLDPLSTAGHSTILADATIIDGATVKTNGAKNGTYTLAKVDATHLSLTDGAGNVQVATVAATGAQSVSFSQFGVSFTTTGAFDTAAGGTAGAGDKIVVATAAGGHAADFLVSATGGSYGTNDLVSIASAIDLTATTGLAINAASISTQAGAQTALATIDTALGRVNTALGTIGATQSRISFAIDTTKTAMANLSAAESTIRDVDMAQEMTNFSKNQILSQAGTAMLAQANSSAQSVLTLFSKL